MDGEGVPHRMRTDRLADAGDAPGLLAGELDGVSGDWLAGYVTHKEPPLRPHGPVIAAQCFEQFGRKHNVPILLPCSTRTTIRWLSISLGLRRTASEMRRPAA